MSQAQTRYTPVRVTKFGTYDRARWTWASSAVNMCVANSGGQFDQVAQKAMMEVFHTSLPTERWKAMGIYRLKMPRPESKKEVVAQWFKSDKLLVSWDLLQRLPDADVFLKYLD